jgi:hypothetical protein
MEAFEPLAARPVQANPLREEIRKLPTGVGFQGVRSVFVQLSIMASKCEIFWFGRAISRLVLLRRKVCPMGPFK